MGRDALVVRRSTDCDKNMLPPLFDPSILIEQRGVESKSIEWKAASWLFDRIWFKNLDDSRDRTFTKQGDDRISLQNVWNQTIALLPSHARTEAPGKAFMQTITTDDIPGEVRLPDLKSFMSDTIDQPSVSVLESFIEAYSSVNVEKLNGIRGNKKLPSMIMKNGDLGIGPSNVEIGSMSKPENCRVSYFV
ncbi:hypothetical protein B0O99DRAFT_744851 [Bisporella sp. PMI_857]|nr:hypothetical protein B0O99DRAFT_744851 [Bisporella sp. PMI_857]